MKCNVKFYVSRKVFYEPKDLKVYSFFTKGYDIQDCINRAGEKLERMVSNINYYLDIQEICAKEV